MRNTEVRIRIIITTYLFTIFISSITILDSEFWILQKKQYLTTFFAKHAIPIESIYRKITLDL